MTNKVTVGDGEDASCCVCIPVTDPLAFPDNLVGKCSMCGCSIQYRPHAPKKPPKVCLPCIVPELEKHGDAGELNIEINPRTMDDLSEYTKRKMN